MHTLDDLRVVVSNIEGTSRLTGVQVFLEPGEQFGARHQITATCFGIFGCPFSSPSGRVHVGEKQLGFDSFDIGGRVDLSIHMHHVIVFKTANDVPDGIHFTDMGQELVAESLTFGGACDQSGDVHKLHRRRDDFFGGNDTCQGIETRVGDGHHSNVWVDGAKRIVLRSDTAIGQCVKQGRLADIRQSYDATFKAHGRLIL